MAAVTNPRIHLKSSIPYILLHVAAFAWLWTGSRPVDWAVAFALYVVRMFGLTAGYHRYFAHRSFKTGRVVQFLLAALGTTAVQKGPLWWAGHHRDHHRYSDTEKDLHSPKRGFWWSHMLWFLSPAFDETPYDRIRDFAKYPEIVWLEKYWLVPPTLLAIALFMVGGLPMLFVGFFFSTVFNQHVTYTINSLSHVWGTRRFATTDTSRNNAFLAILTLGEGWHNNHHHFPASCRQGFYWWEIDISYLVLRLMAVFGLVWDLKAPNERVLTRRRIRTAADRASDSAHCRTRGFASAR